jgi:3',5'-cyclic AMP phosphodiesterase CpdA
MTKAPIKLWSQQEQARPGTIVQHILGTLFITGFFAAFPTALIVYLSIKGWNIVQDWPTTPTEWFALAIYLAVTIWSLSFIWTTGSGAAERLPARVCLFILGSLPSGFAERTTRGILALSAVLVAIVIVSFLLLAGPFVLALQRPLFAPVSTSVVVLITIVCMVALPTIGLWFVGLLWISLCGCLKVLGTTIRSGFPVRLRVESLPKEFQSSATAAINIAHISDCHLTATAETPTVEGGLGGRCAMEKLISVQWDALMTADAIVLTGDAVDSGHAKEWGEFFELMTQDGLSARTFLVPGNHDLNIADAQSWLRALGPTDEFRMLRKLRFLGALRETRSATAHTFDPDNNVRTIATAIDQESEDLRYATLRIDSEARKLKMGLYSPLHSSRGPPDDYYDTQNLIGTLWDHVFPYWSPLGDDLVLVVLDSNAKSTNVATNGFGEISQTQLKKLEKIGRMFAGSRMVIAMHHHPVDPPGWSAVSRFLSLTNSRDFFRILASACTVEPVILNGHRHLDAASRVVTKLIPNASVAFVYGAPSTSYGRDALGPGFYCIGIEGGGSRSPVAHRTWTACDSRKLSEVPPRATSAL